MVLTDREVTLRPFQESDGKKLAELCNNRKIWDNVRDYLPFPYTEHDAHIFIRQCLQEKPSVTFGVEYQHQLAGCTGLVRQSDVYRLSAEIGYWIGEPYWGLGIATRAVMLLTHYAFDQLGLVRLYSGVFEFNGASRRVLEKAGFRLECIAEKSVIKNNRICNEYRYAHINPAVS